jgi:hypothetical protein
LAFAELQNGRVPELGMGALDGDVAAFLERAPGADGTGGKLSHLLLGFLATEVVPLAERLDHWRCRHRYRSRSGSLPARGLSKGVVLGREPQA